MSRKDYEKVAAIFAGDFATCATSAERYKVRGLMLSLADVFQSDNPRFDRARFYAACAIPPYGNL